MNDSFLQGDRDVIRSLVERVRLQRLARNWSQAEFARRIGLSRRAYQDFETGYGNLTLTNLVKLLGVLGVSGELAELVPLPSPEPKIDELLQPARQRARRQPRG
ncbi:MAG: helix-turn-helix domain-containing protein [Verrucomicrobiota bacterium]